MTRRCLLVFGLLAGLLALSVGGWRLWPRTAITRENAAKIQEGMTLAEVEAILGGRARYESTGHQFQRFIKHVVPSRLNGDETYKVWATDREASAVVFDARQRVVRAMSFNFNSSPPITTAEMFRRWLRL